MDSSLAALSNLSLDARQTDLILKHLNMVSLSLQCVAVCVAVCCNVLQRVRLDPRRPQYGLSLVAMCCSACCGVLQCVATRMT